MSAVAWTRAAYVVGAALFGPRCVMQAVPSGLACVWGGRGWLKVGWSGPNPNACSKWHHRRSRTDLRHVPQGLPDGRCHGWWIEDRGLHRQSG